MFPHVQNLHDETTTPTDDASIIDNDDESTTPTDYACITATDDASIIDTDGETTTPTDYACITATDDETTIKIIDDEYDDEITMTFNLTNILISLTTSSTDENSNAKALSCDCFVILALSGIVISFPTSAVFSSP